MAEAGDWRKELETERAMKNEFMAGHVESPFVSGRIPFHELVYFPPDPAFRVTAKLHGSPRRPKRTSGRTGTTRR